MVPVLKGKSGPEWSSRAEFIAHLPTPWLCDLGLGTPRLCSSWNNASCCVACKCQHRRSSAWEKFTLHLRLHSMAVILTGAQLPPTL